MAAFVKTGRLSRFAWGVLAYNLGVILWGAWVRVTGSGAGCGSHWPTCNGEVLPRDPSTQTLIELSHRLTSGLDGFLVLGLLVAVFRSRPRGHPARGAATAAFIFLLIEAAIGAGLVKFELVAGNASAARAWVMSAHLVNTLLLVGALTRTAWLLGTEPPPALAASTASRALFAARLGLVAVVITGGIAALGDTLFPAQTLAHGIAQDFDANAPLLLRLRLLHPVLAVVAAIALILAASYAAARTPSPHVRRLAHVLHALVGAQLVAGVVNVALLAPGWMQLLHLLIADLIWIAAVVLGLTVQAAGEASLQPPDAAPALTAPSESALPRR